MKNFTLSLLLFGFSIAASAQSYVKPAPESGFDIASGKDYVVFYAPSEVITTMGNNIKSNQALDKNGVNSTCDYWSSASDLSVCNTNADIKNSWGTSDCFNITPTGLWGGVGLACFRAITGKYDLSMLDDDYILHMGVMNNSTVTNTGIELYFGDQTENSKNIVKLYLGSKARVSGFYVLGNLTNDSKWYYIDIPVSVLKSTFTSFNPSTALTKENFFVFGFESSSTASTTSSVLEPNATVKTYTVTSLKSAMGLDAFFFYKDASTGIKEITTSEDNTEHIYDLLGRPTEMNHSGLFIIKKGNTTKKVAIK